MAFDWREQVHYQATTLRVLPCIEQEYFRALSKLQEQPDTPKQMKLMNECKEDNVKLTFEIVQFSDHSHDRIHSEF